MGLWLVEMRGRGAREVESRWISLLEVAIALPRHGRRTAVKGMEWPSGELLTGLRKPVGGEKDIFLTASTLTASYSGSGLL